MSVCRFALIAVCTNLAGVVAADAPPPAFFTGQYRMIGTDGQYPVDQRLRIDPEADGFAVTTCDGQMGLLAYDTAFEMSFLAGNIGIFALNCQYFVDHDNYPLLACYGENGARLTLWPDNDGFATAPLVCP
ncbi:MAG: hypothetical protein ACSHWS_02635 [Sulfitobacter sp.]